MPVIRASHRLCLVAVCLTIIPLTLYAHGANTPLPSYVVTPSNPIKSEVKIFTQGKYRYINSNGIAAVHGNFPNAYDRGYMMTQNYHFRVPLNPKQAKSTTPLQYCFGVLLDGVPIIPMDAEWWKEDPKLGWHYYALAKTQSAIPLGLDLANGHVHPIGVYHYHGLPQPLYQSLIKEETPPKKMILVGYATDGFPLYGKYGYVKATDKNSALVELKTSYLLKMGARPASGPPGSYDGTFEQDYEYIAGSGDLDECNGRFGVTLEYPQGIYYYVATEAFPSYPRCFRGTPDKTFSPKTMFAAAPTKHSICSTLDNSKQRYLYGCPECPKKMPADQRKIFCPKGYFGR